MTPKEIWIFFFCLLGLIFLQGFHLYVEISFEIENRDVLTGDMGRSNFLSSLLGDILILGIGLISFLLGVYFCAFMTGIYTVLVEEKI